MSGNLIVQLGSVTEDLNRRWYEANTGHVVSDVQKHVRHPGLRWMAATLDGRVEASGAVLEANILPWYWDVLIRRACRVFLVATSPTATSLVVPDELSLNKDQRDLPDAGVRSLAARSARD